MGNHKQWSSLSVVVIHYVVITTGPPATQTRLIFCRDTTIPLTFNTRRTGTAKADFGNAQDITGYGFSRAR